MRKLGSMFLAVMVVFLVMAAPRPVAAANNGELVQATGDKKVYYIEGVLKRWVKDTDTLTNWGFSTKNIRRISKSELNGHPTGPALTRVVQYGGTVYFIESGTRRYVPSASALGYYGYSFASLTDVNTDTFFRLPEGSVLDVPKFVRVPGDARAWYLDGSTRRPFKDKSVELDYLVERDSLPVSAAAKNIPVGATITSLVNHNGTVWVVMGKKRFYITSEAMILYNKLKWSDLSVIGDDMAGMLPEGGTLRPPSLVQTPGNGKVWLVDDDGSRRWVTSIEMMNNWGYSTENITIVPNDVVYKYPEVSELTQLIRHGSDTYYVANGYRKKLLYDLQMDMYGLRGMQIINVGDMGLTATGDGGDLEGGLTRLEGYDIPNVSGKVGREQHLYLSTNEANLGRTDASAAVHYSVSGTPSAAQNGMAGGYGSFGSSSSPASTDQERYYINMRWNYAEWYEDTTTLDSFGRWMTRTRNLNMTAKNWHRHKKVVVTNPANGRTLVASIEEAGPAMWTGRVAGLSPEAMNELGASTNDSLNYYWAANQNISLGRVH